jgi:hypothetical protein
MASHRIPLAVLVVSLLPIVALGQNSKEVIPLPFEYCVVGAPLTATRTLDYEPTQNSSDPVKLHRDATLYRNSEGRTRTEFKYPDQPQPVSVFIQDCVAGLYYSWRVGDTVAKRWKMKHVGHTYDAKTAPNLDNDKDAEVIDGVPTRHSYRTLKEKEGKIEQFHESWYAPSLDLYLVEVFYTADIGKTTSRIFNLKMTEPDVDLFQVPEGMAIKDNGSTP